MITSADTTKHPTAAFVVESVYGGRVQVRVNPEALAALGAYDSEESRAATLARHMPRLRALALQLAGRSRCPEVTIRSADIWWSSRAR